MELLWSGVVLAYFLGAAIYFVLGDRTPRCRDCQTSALMMSRQIADSSPPVFEVVYSCPRCRDILWKRFVHTVNE
jgi:uncharacterized protein with PIN domain